MLFPANLRKVRKQKGLTQQALADKLKVSVDTIRRWESGKRKPNYEDVNSISHVLAISRDLLFGDRPPQEGQEGRENRGQTSLVGNRENQVRQPQVFDFNRVLNSANNTKHSIERADSLTQGEIEIIESLLRLAQEALQVKKSLI